MLFASNDDIVVLQNELNVIESRLAEETQLLLSELDNGNIDLADKVAKDHNLSLQKFFKLNSALVKMYEVKLKLVNVPKGVTITDSQQQQVKKEIKELEEVFDLSMKRDTGVQDVFDTKFFDNLLNNFNEKCPLLHSILQTLLITDQRKRVYKSPEYKLTCGVHALSLLMSVRNERCKNGVRLLLGLVCVTFGAGKQFMNLKLYWIDSSLGYNVCIHIVSVTYIFQ